jgi:uncharacterized protein YndB with AHSA1/START domain
MMAFMSNTHQVYELFVHAPAAKVWEALTRGEKSREYFFGTAIESSFQPGADLRYTFPDGTVAVSGKVLEIEPGKRLVTTWAVEYDPACAGETSKVTITLDDRGAVTKLRTVHECEGAPNTANSVANDGWSYSLSSMKSLLETGTALPMPEQAS